MDQANTWVLDEPTTEMVRAIFVRAAEISEEANKIRRAGLITAFRVAEVPQHMWPNIVADFDADKDAVVLLYREPEQGQIQEQEAKEPG